MPGQRVENTIDGFMLALDHGANGVELDVHCSADGVVVVFHDFKVHGRAVATMSWRELSRIDLGNGATMPTLADVLAAIGDRATVYIELKGVDIERDVLDVARAHGRRFAIHSFDHDAVARVAAMAPEIRRGVLLDRGAANPSRLLRDSVKRTGAADVWPHWSLVTADLVGLAHALGARVVTWTVNARDVAETVLQAGVDGICTDDVRLLSQL
jgi:glycerophosphoryl diester phosphodiesterase